jgi:CRISPR-associated endonuclease/helicase Cas3
LRSHLRSVAQRALESARAAQHIRADEGQDSRRWKENFHKTAFTAGLLHDLGKYRKEFQEYLLGQRRRSNQTNHAVYGSAAAIHQFGDDASAFAIAGHHAGLHDLSMLDDLVNGPKYSAYEKYGQLLTLAQGERELGAFPESNPVTMGSSDDSEKHCYEFMIRMLFSDYR